MKVSRHDWSGPHKLLVYKIDSSTMNGKRVAYIEVELGQDKLKRWLLLGDQRVIRRHILGDQKQQRSSGESKTARRVRGEPPSV